MRESPFTFLRLPWSRVYVGTAEADRDTPHGHGWAG
jgi:hypothetical protein